MTQEFNRLNSELSSIEKFNDFLQGSRKLPLAVIVTEDFQEEIVADLGASIGSAMMNAKKYGHLENSLESETLEALFALTVKLLQDLKIYNVEKELIDAPLYFYN